MIETDPNAPSCAPIVNLVPSFVAPSGVEPNDVVAFDGSPTDSTLIVPKANYTWAFGDGTTAIGPSVVHSFGEGGTYNVTLTVTDRGGNTASITQAVTILGATGQPVPTTPPVTPPAKSPGATKPAHKFNVSLQLRPQGLSWVLSHGVAVRVRSNSPANGIATVLISRGAAHRAHIRVGRGPAVAVGVGTVSSVRNGTVTLHLRLSRVATGQLRHLRHVTMTIRLALVARDGQHLRIDAAGRY